MLSLELATADFAFLIYFTHTQFVAQPILDLEA
jgi:hypothetical protein